MGLDINVHDQWAVESMGPIQDRTVERLGVSDRAVTANRRLLLRAIDDVRRRAGDARHGRGRRRCGELTGPLAVDTISPTEDWQQPWREHEAERRAARRGPAALRR